MIRDNLVRLRPRSDTLYTSRSRTVLATERSGFILSGPEHGLFVHQTRLLSKYVYLIDGQQPVANALSNVEQHSWLGYYIALPPGVETGEPDRGSGMMEEISQQTLELRVSRYVGEGIHEDLDLTNFTQQPTSFRFSIEADADFADTVETKRARQQRGKLTREWCAGDAQARSLVFDYRAEHAFDNQEGRGVETIHRGLTIEIEHSDSPAAFEDDRISFRIDLEAGGRWHACLNFIPFIDGKTMRPVYGCRSFGGGLNIYDERRKIFLDESISFSTSESSTLAPVVVGALAQAKRDLASLRLYDLDISERAWTMAAGLPIYVALYGRDVLTAGWQAALCGPDMMRGALAELAAWQGREVNDWRDEQPGRMLHEAHTGPLAMLNFNPRARYYGAATTSGFYPVVVSELWHWTGDKEMVRPFIKPALDALLWLDRYADHDGDGFYEYITRSEQGTRNQGWKDSADAIVYDDGRQVAAPVATCEEQAFAYIAKLQMSEVLWWLDEKDDAKRLYREATELKKRFNESFWIKDEGFIAMGLDSEKRQIRSIGSNPGHCLAAAIVDQEHAASVAARLMKDDLFSGWGIRTLSSDHRAFNPYSYHRGSIWPVEQGTFALAFFRYGLHEAVERVCRAQFELAAMFDHFRLPELFSGHQRDADHPFPAFYPQANSPQAWSSSALFSLVQAMLGLYPYAPLNMLLIDPHLPEWLPEITLANLRVGEATATIRFFREKGGQSSYDVLDRQGSLHVLRQPSPWSLTASFAERLKDALTSMLP
ncbi:MAG TPA: glycogen debranching N-terminal domain-containing protein [Blastocatellia bacterium]|nr:glycogen debranching N-terminal domain-containing protein [Blastocatellia bacterium]